MSDAEFYQFAQDRLEDEKRGREWDANLLARREKKGKLTSPHTDRESCTTKWCRERIAEHDVAIAFFTRCIGGV